MAGLTHGSWTRRGDHASSRSSRPGPTAPASRWPGIYEFWRDPAVTDADDPLAWLTTFAVITGPAEPGLDRIHDRQPLVLEPEEWATWLDPGTGAADVVGLLERRPPGRFTAHPVSTAVSSSRSNGPHLLDPVPPEELVGVVDPMTGEVLGGAG